MFASNNDVFTLTDEKFYFIKDIVDKSPSGSRIIQAEYGEITRKNGNLKRFKGWKNLNIPYIQKRDSLIIVKKNTNYETYV